MEERLQKTRSVCPICKKNLIALRILREDAIYLSRECPEHGLFETPVWRNRVDFDEWCAGAQGLAPGQGLSCPESCGLCAEHEQKTCCCLLEVTPRCNLSCRFCFAHGGEADAQPDLEELKADITRIAELCGKPLLQLSGGEPTMRDDLPELIRWAKEAGCPYVQLNSNGIRLAQDDAYTAALAEAGLSFVFLQFDGVTDDVYRALRGRELLAAKERAVESCGRHGLGVTLVPTVVRGVNDRSLGDIVRWGASRSPTVRGVHFQPVSYFGRYPEQPADRDRYTLDELLADLCEQTGLEIRNFTPSRCDHPLCGFHGSFLCGGDGSLRALTGGGRAAGACARTTARQNREYVATHWSHPGPNAAQEERTGSFVEYGRSDEIPDLDTFLSMVRSRSFTLSSMAFQDRMNLDIERLHRCSLHVYADGSVQPFCAHYM